MRRILGMTLAIIFAFGGAFAQSGLDQAFEHYHTLGACVAVFQNGEITFTHTYGVLSPGGEKITENTLFQVGSISKMVGNIGLLQLLWEKGISLDASLSEVFGFEVEHPTGGAITLRQVMTHTAGLRDGSEYQRALEGRGKKLSTLFRDYRGSVFDREIQPGKTREYSNFGGGLIGALIEKLSGQTLDDYMQEHVFGPLGITAAYQIGKLPLELPAADIYRMPKKEPGRILRNQLHVYMEADGEKHYVLTAGRLVISAPDLARILIALCDGGIFENTRILPESAVSEMITPQNHRGTVDCESGHGLFVNIVKDVQVQGRTLYGHGGKAYGMICAAYFDPVDRTGVVMLTNGCDDRMADGGVGALGKEILTLCYHEIIEPAHVRRDPFAVE